MKGLILIALLLITSQYVYGEVAVSIRADTLRSYGNQSSSNDLVLRIVTQTNETLGKLTYELGIYEYSFAQGTTDDDLDSLKEFLSNINETLSVQRIPSSYFKTGLTSITFNASAIDNSNVYDAEILKVMFDTNVSPLNLNILGNAKKSAAPESSTISSDSQFKFNYEFDFTGNTLAASRTWTFSIMIVDASPVSSSSLKSSISIQPPLVTADQTKKWTFSATDGIDTYQLNGSVTLTKIETTRAMELLSTLSSEISTESLGNAGTIVNGIFSMNQASSANCTTIDFLSSTFISQGACQIDSDCCNSASCSKNTVTNKGSCVCKTGFIGSRCEITQSSSGTDILDSVKSITQNIAKLLNNVTVTQEIAENAIFSLESVVRVSDIQVLNDAIQSFSQVASMVRTPAALQSLVRGIQASDANLDQATTNQTLLQEKQVSMQQAVKSALEGVATTLSSASRASTIQIGDSIKAQFKLADTSDQKPTIAVNANVAAEFKLDGLLSSNSSQKIAAIAYNFPKSNLRSFKYADKINDDVLDFSILDITNSSNPSKPTFTGSSPILEFTSNIANVSSSQGVSCSFFNETSKKFEYKASSNTGAKYSCSFDHNSIFAATKYTKYVREKITSVSATHLSFLSLITIMIYLIFV